MLFFFNFLLIKESWKKNVAGFQKIASCSTVFNTDNNMKLLKKLEKLSFLSTSQRIKMISESLKTGVCCRVYYFWLFISLIAWGKKLSLSRLVGGIGCCGDVFLRAAERADCGTGGWSPWWSSELSLYAWCRQCGGQFARPFAKLCGCQRCCFQTRRWCSRSGCSPQCRCRLIWGCRNPPNPPRPPESPPARPPAWIYFGARSCLLGGWSTVTSSVT